jgi:hypothetical protein
MRHDRGSGGEKTYIINNPRLQTLNIHIVTHVATPDVAKKDGNIEFFDPVAVNQVPPFQFPFVLAACPHKIPLGQPPESATSL